MFFFNKAEADFQRPILGQTERGVPVLFQDSASATRNYAPVTYQPSAIDWSGACVLLAYSKICVYS